MYNEVCFAHFILGESGGMHPRKVLNFRPSKISSGAFSSIVWFALNKLCTKKSGNLNSKGGGEILAMQPCSHFLWPV